MFGQLGRDGYIIHLLRHVDGMTVLVEIVVAAFAHIHMTLELLTSPVVKRAFDIVCQKLIHLLASGRQAQGSLECSQEFHRNEPLG